MDLLYHTVETILWRGRVAGREMDHSQDDPEFGRRAGRSGVSMRTAKDLSKYV